jgi:hypothetical protein
MNNWLTSPYQRSANFAITAFSEIGGEFIRNLSPLASVVALYNTAGLTSWRRSVGPECNYVRACSGAPS